MNEQDFREQYATLQENIVATPELKESTRKNALQATHSEITHRRTASSWRRMFPLAACLVAVALIAGGIPAITSLLDKERGIPMQEAAASSGFSVRAYAADSPVALELGDDGTVVFDRTLSLYGVSENYATEGYFTGCLFRVEGEDIARVQMNISSGKLYRYTIESFRQGDDPDRMRELVTRKSLNRGMGTYYGAYDQVMSLPTHDGVEAKNDPDTLVKVGLSKIYGSTIDVSATDDPGIANGETSFGLWTNEGHPDELTASPEPYAPVIDQFEGQTLTITITFEDGHSSTQVIKLHAANFLLDSIGGADQNTAKLIPEIVPDSEKRPGGTLYSLYGVVVETNNEPFPLPLDQANDMANTVLPAATLPRQDDTRPTETTLDKNSILGEGATIEAMYRDDGSYIPLIFSYPKVERHDVPPHGKTLGDFNRVIYGSHGDTAYVNKCSNEVFGYGFNEDGTLTSDDFTYVTATFTLTNTSNKMVEIWPSVIGEFAVIIDDGKIATTNTGYDLDFEVSENAISVDEPQRVGIAAGDTIQITLLRVLSNRLADDDSLLFIPNNKDYSPAFAVGNQI